jgi:hypothetical protein
VAFKSFFGDHARKLKISSIKGVTGNHIHTYLLTYIHTYHIPGEVYYSIHTYKIQYGFLLYSIVQNHLLAYTYTYIHTYIHAYIHTYGSPFIKVYIHT